jgi:ubiquinone/menaquinone biosynthesis C-methylase UbiE
MSSFSTTKIAAWLGTVVSRRREASGLYREIAGRLPLENAQRVLDIGTGTGLQLRAIHQIQPHVELYGLDLSAAAVASARKALKDLDTDLRAGDVAETDYPDDFFDLATCNASFSYWKRPLDSLNEIYRILKPKGQALLFEPQRDIDIDDALDRIRKNMADQSFIRRWGAVQLNKFALQRGSSLGMKLYSLEELTDLAQASHFGKNSRVENTTLLNIPIFVCIHLYKPESHLKGN